MLRNQDSLSKCHFSNNFILLVHVFLIPKNVGIQFSSLQMLVFWRFSPSKCVYLSTCHPPTRGGSCLLQSLPWIFRDVKSPSRIPLTSNQVKDISQRNQKKECINLKIGRLNLFHSYLRLRILIAHSLLSYKPLFQNHKWGVSVQGHSGPGAASGDLTYVQSWPPWGVLTPAEICKSIFLQRRGGSWPSHLWWNLVLWPPSATYTAIPISR